MAAHKSTNVIRGKKQRKAMEFIFVQHFCLISFPEKVFTLFFCSTFELILIWGFRRSFSTRNIFDTFLSIFKKS